MNTWVYNGNNLSTAFSNSPSARPLDKATYVIGPVITGLALSPTISLASLYKSNRRVLFNLGLTFSHSGTM